MQHFELLFVLFSGLALVTSITYHPRLSIPTKRSSSPELNTEYWYESAQATLSAKLQRQANLKHTRAKNIIMFLGDGMSVHTMTATRAFTGDIKNQLSFEQFPYLGLSKTYAVDAQVPDSAATATAYLTGVKTNFGTIGVSAEVPFSDCERGQNEQYHTQSIAKWAQDAGKWAGLVTTTRVTHASPAGVFAHTADRNWEYDAYIAEGGCDSKKNVDIARQLVEWPVGKALRVIMGGGRQNFISNTIRDENGQRGLRTDGRNLIVDWLVSKKTMKPKYVWNKKGLLDTDLQKIDYLLGLFSSSHCPYHGDLEREGLMEDVPSLSEMTAAAIKMLSRNKEGFFLFVEGGKIDMAHHENKARISLEETAEFAKAVEVARNLTSDTDTLIVTTSDHSHTMTINGWPRRENDILGLTRGWASDNLPYNILSYANGPGYAKTYSDTQGRIDVTNDDFTDPNREYMAAVPLEYETHGGEDVGIFASGPSAHYFSGNYEQSIIPMLMAMAAEIGPFSPINSASGTK